MFAEYTANATNENARQLQNTLYLAAKENPKRKLWRGPDCINQNQDVFNWVQNNLNEIKSLSKWIIHAQHCNLKLIIKAAPEETCDFVEIDPIHEHQ
ncbi:hypothetical protein ABES58_24080 [Paenibacillus lautus]|uniref:hypothetical protein n=1 Tax=Paenibacillus lautus TaxID=1401 RepID=UPI003D2C5D1E